MRFLRRIGQMIAGLAVFLTIPVDHTRLLGEPRDTASGQGGGRGFIEVWSPMPLKPPAFVPPNKAHTKLSDLLAKHNAQQEWTEVVVHDHLFHGEYIAMAPGAKTPRRFHQDHRIWWVVQDGQIRFTIEGQEPFIASKGFLVQVPKRLAYQLETVGNRPSLRFEMTNPNAHTMYPADETPTPVPGVKYERARVAAARGSYDDANVPYIDYNLTIAGKQKPKRNPTQFIGDAHDGGYVNVGIVNILRGDPKTQTPPQPGDRGHYHLTGPEAWFVLEGQNEFLIGDLPVFVANQGDVVYAPAQTWHRPRHVGTGMATRLAIVGYADSHVYSPEGERDR